MTVKLGCFLLLFSSASPALALSGLYGTACLPVEELSARKDFVFSPESFEMVQTVFGDNSCTTPAYDFSFTGHYTYDPSAQTIDFIFETSLLTALDARIAEAFSQAVLCGIDDWQAARTEDVTGKNCGGQPIPGRDIRIFDKLNVADEGIYFGLTTNELNGTSPELRPFDWDVMLYEAK